MKDIKNDWNSLDRLMEAFEKDLELKEIQREKENALVIKILNGVIIGLACSVIYGLMRGNM